MTERFSEGRLQVAAVLHRLVNERIAPGTGIRPDAFWAALESIVEELGPKLAALLRKRDELQAKLDIWCRSLEGKSPEPAATTNFLIEIGYLAPEGADFEATTLGVDPEIATVAGPQLVVPVMNARYALNAANARWGSLYDALYGTDIVPESDGCEKTSAYNPRRGARVIAMARAFLDQAAPLAQGSHKDAVAYSVSAATLVVKLTNGTQTGLEEASKFAGYSGQPASPRAVLLRNHRLHIEVQIDRATPIGPTDPAGVKDVLLEAALTTIEDFEDSIAAVDAEDKALVYANWLGLMKGDLTEPFRKVGHTIH